MVHYSQNLNEFIHGMLHKKKEDRPLIIDLIDFFYKKNIPVPRNPSTINLKQKQTHDVLSMLNLVD